MQKTPRVMAIHDLSGVGKCSLTVILPILSAMGVEVAALPTAVLSTHTGEIEGYTYRDLTDDLLPIARHWRSLGLPFDAIYSGWLGSKQQCGIVRQIFSLFADQAPLRVVDPVMGDHGKLYATYSEDRVDDMRGLIQDADIITPNLTEAAFLLEEPCEPGPLSEAACRRLTGRLAALGARRVVVTGICTGEGKIAAAAYDLAADRFSLHETPKVEGRFYGTGDVFAAALVGALCRGRQLSEAASLAARFTHGCVARTHAQKTDPRFGVDFERGLPALMMEATNDAPFEQA